jgi:hypothetical protein
MVWLRSVRDIFSLQMADCGGVTGSMIGTEAMTCQELLALSGALSAALPTGQLGLGSFFSSFRKGGKLQQEILLYYCSIWWKVCQLSGQYCAEIVQDRLQRDRETERQRDRETERPKERPASLDVWVRILGDANNHYTTLTAEFCDIFTLIILTFQRPQEDNPTDGKGWGR